MFGFDYTSFQAPVCSTVGGNKGIYSVAIADWDNDGRFTAPVLYAYLDGMHPWAVASGDFNRVNVILGNGDGNFGKLVLCFTGVATANYGTSGVNVFLGHGNIDDTFQNSSTENMENIATNYS